MLKVGSTTSFGFVLFSSCIVVDNHRFNFLSVISVLTLGGCDRIVL